MPARHGYLEQAVVEASASASASAKDLSHPASGLDSDAGASTRWLSTPHPAVVVEAVETVTTVHLQRSAGRGMRWEMGLAICIGYGWR